MPAPVQRGSFACSASSQGPEMSSTESSVVVVGSGVVVSGVVCVSVVCVSVVAVSVVSVVGVELEGLPPPSLATTTAARIPKSATARTIVTVLRMPVASR